MNTEETIREEAEKVSREIFYSQATNGKAEGNIKVGADKIVQFAKALQLNKEEWIPFEKYIPNGDCLILFDTGEIRRYDEGDWPASIVTHFKTLPQPPKVK